MHKIVLKKQLSHDMCWIEFEAPFVAKKAKPGQFIIFRVDEYGERVPISMAGRQAAPQYRGRAPPPDPRLTVRHTGGVPSPKILSIENRLSGHPAPRL